MSGNRQPDPYSIVVLIIGMAAIFITLLILFGGD